MTKKSRTRVVEIPAGNLTFDKRYQRDLVPSRVKKLAANLDLDALGILTVAKQGDEYMVVDGQHRVAAVLHHGFGEWKVKCNVYEGLNQEEQAKLFRELNDTRRITKYDDYRAGLVEGDEDWVKIDRGVKAAGLSIEKQQADGSVNCVAALQKVYGLANGRGDGLVRDTLQILIAAFGVAASSVEAKLVEGAGIVLSTYPDIDHAVLVKKISKFKGGAPGLLGAARALQDIRKGTTGRMVAAVMIDLYNKGRKTGALPAL